MTELYCQTNSSCCSNRLSRVWMVQRVTKDLHYISTLIQSEIRVTNRQLAWRRVVMVNALVVINEVTLRQARLVGPTWMGDRLPTGKPSRYVTSHPGQLSLAISPWVGAMSTSESWGVNRHTARYTSPVSVVSQCKLVSGWGLRKRRSAPPHGPCGSGRTLLLYYVYRVSCDPLLPSYSNRCFVDSFYPYIQQLFSWCLKLESIFIMLMTADNGLYAISWMRTATFCDCNSFVTVFMSENCDACDLWPPLEIQHWWHLS